MSVLDNIPMPKLHRTGALYAERRECEWWPEPSVVAADIALIEEVKGRQGVSDKQARVPRLDQHNGLWIHLARRFLTDYTVPFASGAHKDYANGDHGHISEALTRLRDDRVVLDSIPGVSSKVREGLDIKHRDVLAAIALLSQVDRAAGPNITFRRGALERVKTTETDR